jgi:hypothetical protein
MSNRNYKVLTVNKTMGSNFAIKSSHEGIDIHGMVVEKDEVCHPSSWYTFDFFRFRI